MIHHTDLLATVLLLVATLGTIVWSALGDRRAGGARVSSTRPRNISITYGTGYGLLGWEEEWEFEAEGAE